MLKVTKVRQLQDKKERIVKARKQPYSFGHPFADPLLGIPGIVCVS
jgi:hypothetical protein